MPVVLGTGAQGILRKGGIIVSQPVTLQIFSDYV